MDVFKAKFLLKIIEEIKAELEEEDIKEDLRLIEREFKNNSEFVQDTLNRLFNLKAHTTIGLKIEVKYFRRGNNKQVYLARITLASGRALPIFALSAEARGELIGDFSKEMINDSLNSYRILKQSQKQPGCPVGGRIAGLMIIGQKPCK